MFQEVVHTISFNFYCLLLPDFKLQKIKTNLINHSGLVAIAIIS